MASPEGILGRSGPLRGAGDPKLRPGDPKRRPVEPRCCSKSKMQFLQNCILLSVITFASLGGPEGFKMEPGDPKGGPVEHTSGLPGHLWALRAPIGPGGRGPGNVRPPWVGARCRTDAIVKPARGVHRQEHRRGSETSVESLGPNA